MIPEFKPEALVDPALIAFAESILKEVKAGNVVAMGVVSISPRGNIGANTIGQLVPLYVGCEIMKNNLMSAIAPPVKPSPLLRPV